MSQVRCGGPEIAEYAVGRLPLARLRAWDRHLVTCRHCGARVEEERRLHAALMAVPVPSRDLRVHLLSLAGPGLVTAGPESRPAPRAPGGRSAVLPSAHLALMAPSAPAAHRSVRRPLAMAVSVAGLGATAVWTLALVGAPVVDHAPAPARVVVAPLERPERDQSISEERTNSPVKDLPLVRQAGWGTPTSPRTGTRAPWTDRAESTP